jgi:hypothetical protein
MHIVLFLRRVNVGITVLVLLALWLLPLGLGMRTSVRAGSMHDHHAQHTSHHSAPSSSCEHFHICCACLVFAPIVVRLFDAVAVPVLLVQFQSTAQDIPKPPPRG